jgi:hypothetical protein
MLRVTNRPGGSFTLCDLYTFEIQTIQPKPELPIAHSGFGC